METSGSPTLQLAVSASDVPRLAETYDDPGPFASIYLSTEAGIENAAQRSELRWKELRREMAANGAVDKTLDAVDPLVPEAHLRGETLAVIVGSGGVLLAEHLPDPPTRDLGVVAPLPRVGPLLEWHQSTPAHVIVLADRRGADIIAVTSTGKELQAEAGGGDDPISKVNPGGWSQRRYQQRAENVWEKNADDVAAAVASLVQKVDARVVVVAGEERAVPLLREALPPEVATIVREVEGGRALGIDTDELATAVTRMVATSVAEDTVALLEKFREEMGQHDRAAAGVTATVQALQMAQVETLLIHDDPDDQRTLWFGPTTGAVATDRRALADMGVDEPQQARLVDVLIRAALCTGAGVRMIPSAAVVPEGVGAVLRFTV